MKINKCGKWPMAVQYIDSLVTQAMKNYDTNDHEEPFVPSKLVVHLSLPVTINMSLLEPFHSSLWDISYKYKIRFLIKKLLNIL